MSQVLRDWIAPVFERELEAAARSLERKVCHSDAVSVHLTKGKHIQIVDFNGQNVFPFIVTVSDGTTLIQASFDQAGIELFRKRFCRSFTSITGGIVAIEDYYLSFNPTATPSQTLMLKIAGFKLWGSEGSKTFGQPSDILKRRSIQDTLTQVKNFLSGIENVLNTQGAIASPMRSQVGDLSDSGTPFSAGGASQADFATQVERATGNRAVPAVLPAKAYFTSYNRLLGLLRKDQEPGLNTTNGASENIAGKQASAQSMSAVNSYHKKPPLAPVPERKILETASKLEAKANEQQSQHSKSSQLIRTSDPMSQFFPKSDQEDHMPPIVTFPVNDDSEKENRQERRQKPIRTQKAEPKESPIEQLQQCVRLSFVDQFQAGNPFQGLKRVPRKYIRISEAQQTMLEGDSWFSHQPNDQKSYVSIPAEVRDDIAAFVARQIDSSAIEQNVELSSQDSDDSSQSECDSERSDKADENKYADDVDFDEEDKENDLSITGRPNQDVDPNIDVLDTFVMAEVNAFNEVNVVVSQGVQSDEGRPDSLGDAPADVDASTFTLYHGTGVNHICRGVSPLEFSQSLPYKPHECGSRPLISRSSRYQRIPVVIPSSSPTEEEELELAVPHAVGDVIEESDEDLEENPETSQEVPSTDAENSRMVQVEQTHYANSYALNREDIQPKVANFLGHQRNRRFDDVSSDPVIPATFHDASSQQPSLTLDSDEVEAEPVKTTIVLDSQDFRQYNSSHLDDNVPRTQFRYLDPENEEVDSLVQQQLFVEYNSPQQKPTAPFPSSPTSGDYQKATPKLSTPRSERDIGPTRAQNPPSAIYSPSPEPTVEEMKAVAEAPTHRKRRPQIISSPSYEHPDPVDFGRSNTSPLDKPSTSKRNHDVQEEPESFVVSKRRWRTCAAAISNEDDGVPRDAKEMARASRHSFNDRFTTPVVGTAESFITSPQSSSTVLKIPNTIPLPTLVPVPAILDAATGVVKCSTLCEDSPIHLDLGAPEENSLNFCAEGASGHSRSVAKVERPTPLGLDENATDYITLLDHSDDGTPDNNNISNQPESAEPSYFDQFKSMYPEYEGNKTDFTKALVYIESLGHGKQLLHSSMCDDFIRVYPTDHCRYLRQLSPYIENRFSGWEFYDKTVVQRVFQKELITPGNLQIALLSLDPRIVKKARAFFIGQVSTELDGGLRRTSSYTPTKFRRSQKRPRELGHSPANTQLSAEDRNGSPDFGAEIRTSKPRQPRRPFFETLSQLPAAKGKGAPVVPANTTVASLTESERNINHPRALPWSSSSGAAVAISPEMRKGVMSPTSTSALCQSDHFISRPLKRSKYSGSKTPLQPFSLSPILGQGEGPVIRRFNPVERPTSSSTCRHVNDLKSPSLPAPKTISCPASSTSKDGTDELRTVQGWLKDVPPITFKHFIKNKRLSSGLSSRPSTPSSTPGKRFSIKPAKATF